MALEIERKFRLKDPGVLEGLAGARLFQAYLAHGPATLRIRIHDENAWLTVKGPSNGATRLECEYPIPLTDARQMAELAGITYVAKTRYKIEHAGHIFEVDRYRDALEGLFSVEVELDSASDIVALPEWVGEELTGRREWDNDFLAKHGRPELEACKLVDRKVCGHRQEEISMKTFEVTGFGFDASSDATDDRVFWVKAPSVDVVKQAIAGTNARFHDTIDSETDIDFHLPAQADLLKAKLMGFELAHRDVEQTLETGVSSTSNPQIDALEEKYVEAAQELRSKQAGLLNYAPELHTFIGIRDALKAHPDFPGTLPKTYFSGGSLDTEGVDGAGSDGQSTPCPRG